jgi:putative chitinase
MITTEFLASVAGQPVNSNMRSIVAGVQAFPAGLDRRQRVAQYVAQLCHESGGFRYDRELWGPTPAQERYDTRTDLGNTAARDGDGFLFRGRGGIQITGRANYVAFRDWCWMQGLGAPDFVANPDAVLTDPWEGLGPVWYWTTRDLNRLADAGDIESITRKINGGLNGFDDRVRCYARAALVLLGQGADDLRSFQRRAGLKPDGVPGPITRAALHKALAG